MNKDLPENLNQDSLNLVQIVQAMLNSLVHSADIKDAVVVLPEASSNTPHILAKAGNLTIEGWMAMLSSKSPSTLRTEIPLDPIQRNNADLIFYRPGDGDWGEGDQKIIEIFSRAIADLLSEYQGDVDWLQVTASQRILPVTEEELTRIILDIHDGPVQYLFAAFSQLNKLQGLLSEDSGISAEVTEGLAKIGEMLETALSEIRTFVGTFRPPEFAEKDLIKLIEGLVLQHEQFTNTAVHLEVAQGLPPIPLPVKIALYRIIQEALSNASHHADAKEIFIRIWQLRDHIHIEIEDHGKGFDPPPLDGPLATEEVEHIGLRGMRDRVHLVGGTFRLESSPQKGTLIHVSVPVVS